MEQNEDYKIPRTLDDPKLFFIWDLDNAVIAGGFIFIGVFTNMFLLSLFLSYGFTSTYIWLKNEGGNGLITRFFYWFFPYEITRLGKSIPSDRREFRR